MAYRRNPSSPDELRRLAQQRLASLRLGPEPAMLPNDVQELLEDLEIQRIELEMQNDHLNVARGQLELALSQSSELYDFSPAGTLLLDADGAITKLNLAVASLLGGERSPVLGRRLDLFVREADRPLFNELLARARASQEVQGGELALAGRGETGVQVQIRVAALPDEPGWQVVLLDITERKRIEAQLRASEERLQLALDSVGDGVWDWNVQTGEIVLSRRFVELYGFSSEEYGHTLADWSTRLHPQDKPRVMDEVQAYLSGKSPRYANEHRGLCKDGRWKWIFARGAVVSRGFDGRPLRMIGTHVDISANKQAEAALAAAAQFQRAVFDALSAHLAVLDRQGTIVQTNAAWQHYARASSGAQAGELAGVNYLAVLECMTGGDRATVATVGAGMARVAAGELDQFQLDQAFFAPTEQRWFNLRVTPVRDAQERLLVSHEDVSSLKAAEIASWRLANVDALTGALSRRNFLSQAEQELARACRYELPLMLLLLDLDQFKRINEQHGHAAGDAVLQGLVTRVASVLREFDLLGRLGGEEFAVLLPNTPLEGGRALAQRILDTVRASPITFNGQRIAFSVSIGAGCRRDETSFAALMRGVDAALHSAQAGGRDALVVGPV